MKHETPSIYGVLAEFAGADELVAACKRVKAAGYDKVEAYSPMPVEEAGHALGHKSYLSALIFCGGATGAITGFGMQTWISVFDYPLNVGGRPFFSWPSFIVITFEMTVLFSALTAVIGMIALNGLPQPYHPLFNSAAFERATRNRFFLCIEAADPRFDLAEVKKVLQSTDPLLVEEVPQ
ncbi:MAG: DUF3341 domain-containing protein [Planctomycetes bacterium]|nr:DUF3341 domain-containing protein [Planctomycetota bacterium]